MKDSWGKWGADDEIGALNMIGRQQVAAAARLVRTGATYSLMQPISRAMKLPKHRGGVSHFMDRDGGDYTDRADAHDFHFADDTIMMPIHSGTHIDALCHCWYDGELYNGHPASSIRSSGAKRCGAEKIPPILTRGVLIDFVRLTGAPLADGQVITPALIQDGLEVAGLRLVPSDAVLLRTGWHERQVPGGDIDFDAEPGLGVEAAELLAGAGVSLIGADNFAIEAMPFPDGAAFPVHKRLIRDFGIPLLEGLVLDSLGEAGATEFLFMAAPLAIEGATGSPIHPVAVL